mgnify:CR=1 FL=1
MMLAGLMNALSLKSLIAIVFGVILGIIFGAIPGLSANMAVTLCLPLSFGLDPSTGMVLLVSLYLGGISGGLVSATLLNIPGTPASIATCFDGHPMASKGEAGKALGVGILASFVGGLFSIIVLIFLAPVVARVALKFGPFEYAAIGGFSLLLIAGLMGKSIIKGLIGALLGIMLATIGSAPIDGAPRFTFGLSQMKSGFNIIAVMIGFFAISEVISAAEESVTKQEKITIENVKIKGFGVSLKEILDQKWNLLRSAIIGTFIGILPGLGGSTANVISYAVAKNQSKHSEKFGTGIIDGVIASEASNNATVGGALIPALSLGIPGDVTTAILLGALMIHGVQTGPLLFKTSGVLVYTIFGGLLIANIVMLFVMLFGIRFFSKILSIPKTILLPVVMVLCIVGAFAINNRMFDVWSVLGFGLLGYLLNKVEIPFGPIIMGFILGPIIELYLRRAVMISEGSLLPFVTRPIPAVTLFLSLLFSIYSIVKMTKTTKSR